MTTGDGLAIIGLCYVLNVVFQIIHAWFPPPKKEKSELELRIEKLERTLDNAGIYD